MLTVTFNHCWDCPYMIYFCYVYNIDEAQRCEDYCGWFEKEREGGFPVSLTYDEANEIPDWCPLRKENKYE